MNFYTTNVVEGEDHSGYVTATEPFSRVEWWVGGTLETTDYAASDTQIDSYFTTQYTDLGSESGNDVVVYALAYARNSSDTANAQQTVTVSSASTTPTTPAITPAMARAYPTIEASADWSTNWLGNWGHEVVVEVAVDGHGDPEHRYINLTASVEFDGYADVLQITRHRPGGQALVHFLGNHQFGHVYGTFDEFNPPTLTHERAWANLPQGLNKPGDFRVPMWVGAKVENWKSGEWKFLPWLPAGSFALPLPISYTTAQRSRMRAAWVIGDDVSLGANVVKGKGHQAEEGASHSPLPGTTEGVAKCSWENNVLGAAVLNPHAWVKYVSPYSDHGGPSNAIITKYREDEDTEEEE